MKHLLTTLACLLVGLWTYSSAAHGPSVGNTGGPGSGDFTFNGTVTADGFDSPADEDDGGKVVLKECEGGTNCPAAAAGHSLELGLPDNANPLNGNKSYSPGFSARWEANLAAFDGDIGECLPMGYVTNPLPCGNEDNWARIYHSFYDGVFVDYCLVTLAEPSAANGWDNAGTTDIAYLQMQVFDTTGIAASEIGDPFIVVNNTTTCSGLGTNCADDHGTFFWQVHGTVSGASTVASGGLGVLIDDAGNVSLDGDNDADMRLTVICKYF